jgi:hypothetical protein
MGEREIKKDHPKLRFSACLLFIVDDFLINCLFL